MNGRKGSIATAIVLIVIGAWFLAVELVPAVKAFAYEGSTWPFPILGVGALLALVGLVTWTPGLMIPASIVGGIGGLLYWQNLTGNWESWAYAWTAIPAFVGVGLFLAGIMKRDGKMLVGAAWTLFVAMILFAIFGSFLGNVAEITRYWPVLVIALGVLLLARGFAKKA
ncbi:MAG TPA: hypothetical protein VHO48_08345 [Anaerolineaceae bacterium]|nr:hypothetical protein [Anaerolineaceae bacterium]